MGVYVERRGNSDAGAILIKVDYLNGETMVYAPAAGASAHDHGDRQWTWLTRPEPVDEEQARKAIERQVNFDPDIWVISVEDKTGGAQLDQSTVTEL